MIYQSFLHFFLSWANCEGVHYNSLADLNQQLALATEHEVTAEVES
jgi:hypothetical protein